MAGMGPVPLPIEAVEQGPQQGPAESSEEPSTEDRLSQFRLTD